MRRVTFFVPRGLVVTSLLIITFWGIEEARTFLIPICISALLALLMAPLVRGMRSWHLPEWSAIAVSTLLLILPFFVIIYLLIWQGQAFIRDIPSIIASVNRALIAFVHSELGRRLHFTTELNVPDLLRRFEGSAVQGIQFVISSLGAILGAGSQLALVLLFAVLMLASRRHLRRSMENILEQNFYLKNPKLLDDVIVLIEKFLIARLLIVGIIGGIDTLILVLFSIQYALLMGCFLGIMTLIPAIGFIIAVIPPIFVSFAIGHNFLETLAMILALFVMSIVEGNILTPKMVGKRLNINALATFIGLFGGGLLWGIWGMFLSIPVLGILRITFNAAPSLQSWGELLAEKNGEQKMP